MLLIALVVATFVLVFYFSTKKEMAEILTDPVVVGLETEIALKEQELKKVKAKQQMIQAEFDLVVETDKIAQEKYVRQGKEILKNLPDGVLDMFDWMFCDSCGESFLYCNC